MKIGRNSTSQFLKLLFFTNSNMVFIESVCCIKLCYICIVVFVPYEIGYGLFFTNTNFC